MLVTQTLGKTFMNKDHISNELFTEALRYFPGGVHSPVRAFKSVGGTPIFMKKGHGSRITCVDNRTYIDFCGSWGPLILGHNHPRVRKAINESIMNGCTFGAPTPLANRLGKFIIDRHRYIEQLRFVNSGTEAVMSAIRLARGYTGKNKIVKFEGCYHGHVDSLLVKAGSGLATLGESSSAGIPDSFVKETIVVSLNELETVEVLMKKHAMDIAAIIIEPVPANHGLLIQEPSFLMGLRKLCTAHNVLLIFDEVISGFRVGFDGAAGFYDIQPDIITLGKIMGGGMPVGAFASTSEIMSHLSPEGPVYQAGTLSANPITMAAGYATLQEMVRTGFYYELEQKTSYFVEQVNHHADQRGYEVKVRQFGSIFWIAFSRDPMISAKDIDEKSMRYFTKLHRYLLQNSIYLGPSGYEVGFISVAHTTQELDKSAMVINKGLDAIFS